MKVTESRWVLLGFVGTGASLNFVGLILIKERKVKITFLGTGAAEGIPAINCECPHCRRAREEDGKLVRERGAILFSLPGYELLINTPPEVRALINKYRITHLDGIFATGAGYDHIGGIKEFEYWHGELDFLAEESLFKIIKQEHWTDRLEQLMFHIPYYPGAAIYFGTSSIIPFATRKHPPVFGISVKEGDRRVIYTSDAPPYFTNYARRLMKNCHILIVNTPNFEGDEEHLTVLKAIELKKEVGAVKLILTSINHNNKPHDKLEEFAAKHEGVLVAYDGMVVEI